MRTFAERKATNGFAEPRSGDKGSVSSGLMRTFALSPGRGDTTPSTTCRPCRGSLEWSTFTRGSRPWLFLTVPPGLKCGESDGASRGFLERNPTLALRLDPKIRLSRCTRLEPDSQISLLHSAEALP